MKILELVLLISSAYVVRSGVPPPHPAVVAVRTEEEFLPLFLRSPALRNPHLQELLPLTSLLHPGESPVYKRPSDSVPRFEIYKILTHAGFTQRNQVYRKPTITAPKHFTSATVPHYSVFIDFPDFLYFKNPDALQHL